jgi:hypothetical protein
VWLRRGSWPRSEIARRFDHCEAEHSRLVILREKSVWPTLVCNVFTFLEKTENTEEKMNAKSKSKTSFKRRFSFCANLFLRI